MLLSKMRWNYLKKGEEKYAENADGCKEAGW